MIQHVAGEPDRGAQRCDRCRLLLIDWLEDDGRGWYFRTGAVVFHEAALLATAEYLTTDEAHAALECAAPDVEGVDITYTGRT